MKYFPEFYRILERFHEPRIETVDREFRAKKNSKEFKLYDGIGTGLFPTDTSAAGTLYERARPDAPKYSSLKNRLKVRMLNSLFHLNMKRAGFSDSAQAFYLAHRRQFMVNILVALGARMSAVRMAESTLDLAQRFELNHIALDMARLLRQHASFTGHTKKFEYYNSLVKELQQKYAAELVSNEYFDRITMVFNRRAGGRSQYAREFETYVTELKKLLNETSTHRFQLRYHQIEAMTRLSAGIHADIIEGAQAGLQFLQSAPHLLQREQQADFWFYQLLSYLGVHDYENAKRASIECATYYNPGSNSWFSFAEANFLLLMNTLQFQEANAFYNEVTSHARFPQQSEIARQHWDIFKFYLLYAMKSLPDYDAKSHPLRLNYDGLLKNFDVRRDKEGMNMLIRFAQVIYLVETRNYDTMDEVIRGLVDYRRNHIQAEKTQQSSLFMQLLRMMVRNSYSYKHCLSGGKKAYERLKNEKFEVVNLDQEVQVLPYTWLWDRLLERMKENETAAMAQYR